MTDSTVGLRRKISGAGDLQSVVRTMKAVAASSIEQYDNSVRALENYYRTVELGLIACFRSSGIGSLPVNGEGPRDVRPVGAVVFGSDQGLVGQFNDIVTDFAIASLASLGGQQQIWAVGERVQERLENAGLTLMGTFPVPGSVKAITPLVGRILVEAETGHGETQITELHLFYNHPTGGAVYEPVHQQLLPLDARWQRQLAERPWPTRNLPQVMDHGNTTLRALVREYLFVSLFRSCAESLASENASRLSAMQRADKNIDELLEDMNGTFHRLRQSGIDEELSDVLSGFEALGGANRPGSGF